MKTIYDALTKDLSVDQEWRDTFYSTKHRRFHAAKADLFARETADAIYENLIADGNQISFSTREMYYHFLLSVIYYIEFSCNRDDHTFASILKIAKVSDKPLDSTYQLSTYDVIIFMERTLAGKDERITVHENHMFFSLLYKENYPGKDEFTDNIAKAIQNTRNALKNIS